MTFEEHLKMAADEAAAHIAASFPCESDIGDEFSDAFLCTMQKFIDNWEDRRKQQTFMHRHPIVKYILITAAILLLIFGTLMVVSPEIRAAVTGWFRQELDDSVLYDFKGSSESESDNNNKLRFEMTWIPEGYRFYAIDETEYSTYIYYLKGDSVLTLSYTFGSESVAMYVLLEDSNSQPVSINGMEGEIIISPSVDESSIIIWTDKDQDILFYVDGFEDAATLIKIAEGVWEVQK